MKIEESQTHDPLDAFERKAGETLRRYEEVPPEAMLARIEQTLAARSAAPVRRTLWRRAYAWTATGIAAAIAAGLLLTLPKTAHRTEALPAASMAQAITPADGTPLSTPETPTSAVPARPVPPQQSAAREMTVPDTAVSAEGLPSLPAREPEPVPESSRTETMQTPPTTHHTIEADEAARTLRARTEAYWDRLIAQDSRPNRRHAADRKIALGAYAGNFGAGQADISSADPTAFSDLFVSQREDSGYALATSLTDENGTPTTPPPGHIPEAFSLRHRLPLNVGLSLAVPLTDRLSLVTGINYSYLYSSGQQQFIASQVAATRELHYLGIPLGLSYTFYRTGRFGFYVQGSGMIEKAVACRETLRITTPQDQNFERYNNRIDGVQWSVGVTAGVDFAFTDHIALYLEPGASYYFRAPSQPENYRTAHPLHFAFRIGLRFGV